MIDKDFVFVDEKMGRKSFMTVGICTDLAGMVKINSFICRLKAELIPSLDPDAWYIKGSGDWRKDKKKLLTDSDGKESILKMWKFIGQNIGELSSSYKIIGAAILTEAFYEKNGKQDPVEMLKCVTASLIDKISLVTDKPVQFFTDELNGREEKTQLEILNLASKMYEDGEYNTNLVSWHKIGKGQDESPLHSAMLQFTDIIVYALYRFIFPSEAKNFNLLAESQVLPYLTISDTFMENYEEKGTDWYLNICDYYNNASKLYHHIRFQFVKNMWAEIGGKSELVSSFSIEGKTINRNFADEIDGAIWNFYNMTNLEGKSEGIINLEKYC